MATGAPGARSSKRVVKCVKKIYIGLVLLRLEKSKKKKKTVLLIFLLLETLIKNITYVLVLLESLPVVEVSSTLIQEVEVFLMLHQVVDCDQLKIKIVAF